MFKNKKSWYQITIIWVVSEADKVACNIVNISDTKTPAETYVRVKTVK